MERRSSANAVRPTLSFRLSEETVGVVGKGFPTTRYGELLTRFPTAGFLLSLVLPLAFVLVALLSQSTMDVSLDRFAADPSESKTSSMLIRALTSSWLDEIGNNTVLGKESYEVIGQRRVPWYRQELRFTVNLAHLSEYLSGRPVTPGYLDAPLDALTYEFSVCAPR